MKNLTIRYAPYTIRGQKEEKEKQKEKEKEKEKQQKTFNPNIENNPEERIL